MISVKDKFLSIDPWHEDYIYNIELSNVGVCRFVVSGLGYELFDMMVYEIVEDLTNGG